MLKPRSLLQEKAGFACIRLYFPISAWRLA